jgi:5-methylcytosine-specific restriction protein A
MRRKVVSESFASMIAWFVRSLEGKARSTASAMTMPPVGSATVRLEVGALTWSRYSWSPPLPGRWQRTAMPSLRYSCQWPTCPTKLELPGRCDQHRKQLGSGWAQRPSRGDYRGDWPRIRARVLAEEPNCRLCGAPATEVDHILPIALGGTHDRANLRALDRDCHKLATAAIPRRRRAG